MTTYKIIKSGGLYGVEAIEANGRGGIVYESMFSAVEASRIVRFLNHDDRLTWEEIEDYVNGITDVLPVHTEVTQ